MCVNPLDPIRKGVDFNSFYFYTYYPGGLKMPPVRLHSRRGTHATTSRFRFFVIV